MHLQNKLGDPGQETGKGTANVSEETASRTAAPGSLPRSPEKGQPGNQGAGSPRARALRPSVPCLGRKPASRHGWETPALALTSAFPSALAPELLTPAFFPALSASRPRDRPPLASASRPGPAGHPPPQSPLHPVQAQEASSGAQRRGYSGRRRLLQEAKPLTWLMRFLASPEGSAPCSSSSPIRNSPGRRLRPLLPSRATFGSDAQAKGVELK